MKRPWRCRSILPFFGLNEEYIESVYEETFQLKYYGGWSFYESYNLPIQIRRWFLKRLVKQKEDEAEATTKASRGGSAPNRPSPRRYNLK
jgi:hypothetical protein